MHLSRPTRLVLRRAGLFGAALLLFAIAATVLLWPGRGNPDLMILPEPGAAVSLAQGTEVAVLRVRPGRRPTTVGRGLALADGRISVSIFRGVDVASLPQRGVLLRADLLAMWQVAGDDQRDAVRAAALALASDAVAALDDILSSPVFVARYRPLLNQVVSDAIDAGWKDPDVTAALASAGRTAQQAGLDFLIDDLRPALVDRAPGALWRSLSNGFSTGFGLFGGAQPQTAPLEEAFDAVMHDEAVVDGMRRAIRKVAGSHEVEAFARALARSSARALNRDPRLQKILVDVFRDPAFSPQRRRIGASGVTLLDTAQSQITGLGASHEINALAAAVFRGMIRGEEETVLVLTTDASGPGTVTAERVNP